MPLQVFVILENNYIHVVLVRTWNKNKTKQIKAGRIIIDSNPLFLETHVDIIVKNIS